MAQEKIERYAKKYEHVNKQKNEKVHMLSGIIKCPKCGAGMYGNKSDKLVEALLMAKVLAEKIGGKAILELI